jgi:hypothetical protein
MASSRNAARRRRKLGARKGAANMAKTQAQSDSEKLRDIEKMLDLHKFSSYTGSYHEIPIEIRPTYEVRAGDQVVGAVWREDAGRVFASPVHHQTETRECNSLEEAVAWLLGSAGL